MNQIRHFKSREHIEQEAAAWVIKMDQKPLSASELNELERWLAQSQAHRRSFLALADVWQELDGLTTESEAVTQQAARPSQKQMPIVWSAAAAVLLAIALFTFHLRTANVPDIHAEYQTATGEIEQYLLPDGSRIKLNTRSNVVVDFSAHERAIHLQEGEANFEVAKDPKRPFVVYTNRGSITAVGTAFNVRVQSSGIDLVVTEGKVKVDAASSVLEPVRYDDKPSTRTELPDRSAQQIVAVSAGEKLRFGNTTQHHTNPSQQEIDRQLSWQQGMLAFDSTPLAEAVREISRYTDTHIIIKDPALAELPVGGYFKAGEVDAMLEVLELSFNLSAEHHGNRILLSKK